MERRGQEREDGKKRLRKRRQKVENKKERMEKSGQEREVGKKGCDRVTKKMA